MTWDRRDSLPRLGSPNDASFGHSGYPRKAEGTNRWWRKRKAAGVASQRRNRRITQIETIQLPVEAGLTVNCARSVGIPGAGDELSGWSYSPMHNLKRGAEAGIVEEKDVSNPGKAAAALAQAVALVVPREIREALFIAAAHAWNTGEITFRHDLAHAVDAVADVISRSREEVVELMMQEWLYASEDFVFIDKGPSQILRPLRMRFGEQPPAPAPAPAPAASPVDGEERAVRQL